MLAFSQFTSMLDLAAFRFGQVGIRSVRLEGGMSMEARARAIATFTNDPDVPLFLMSLKAGGVALNLTAASRTVIMDPWWNPAVEQQAQDRIHRLGSTGRDGRAALRRRLRRAADREAAGEEGGDLRGDRGGGQLGAGEADGGRPAVPVRVKRKRKGKKRNRKRRKGGNGGENLFFFLIFFAAWSFFRFCAFACCFCLRCCCSWVLSF